jgi:hypothetical protein
VIRDSCFECFAAAARPRIVYFPGLPWCWRLEGSACSLSAAKHGFHGFVPAEAALTSTHAVSFPVSSCKHGAGLGITTTTGSRLLAP